MTLLPTCREVRERLTEYAEGALTRRERLGLWLHLLVCPACAAFRRGLLALPRLAKDLLGPGAAAPEAGTALREALRRLAGP
jgi:anti-sigma factor ChrR (cupin superfamily)